MGVMRISQIRWKTDGVCPNADDPPSCALRRPSSFSALPVPPPRSSSSPTTRRGGGHLPNPPVRLAFREPLARSLHFHREFQSVLGVDAFERACSPDRRPVGSSEGHFRVGPHHERLPERRMRTPIPLVNACYVVHVERSAFGLPVPMSSLPKQAGRCNIDPCMTVS